MKRAQEEENLDRKRKQKTDVTSGKEQHEEELKRCRKKK